MDRLLLLEDKWALRTLWYFSFSSLICFDFKDEFVSEKDSNAFTKLLAELKFKVNFYLIEKKNMRLLQIEKKKFSN